MAALARSNEARLARYRAATADVLSVADLIRTWQQLHDEDVAVGHIGALVALLGAASTVPELREDLSGIFSSWQGFVEEKVSAAVAGTPLGPFLPTEQAAFVLLALFVGVELLTGLDGNEGRAAELFRAGDLLAGTGALLARMSGSGATCYGVFPAVRDAGIAAETIRRNNPGWFVTATTTLASGD